jgi:hypothetical protein
VGVRHLFVWTDITRDYLAASPPFVERWRGGDGRISSWRRGMLVPW